MIFQILEQFFLEKADYSFLFLNLFFVLEKNTLSENYHLRENQRIHEIIFVVETIL